MTGLNEPETSGEHILREETAVPSVIAIGASAGGVTALQELVSELPQGLEAAVLVVLHLPSGSESYLPEILSRASRLRAIRPQDRAQLEPGRIYVAPPNRHLLLQDGCVRVIFGPTENLHRPSIDVLFRSVAQAYGNRAIGVLLTGSDDDGAGGLSLIQRSGGKTIVQDPDDSLFPRMPLSALRLFEPTYKLRLSEIAPTLSRLAREGAARSIRMEKMSNQPAPQEPLPEASEEKLGAPSAFTCPDCGGSLWELDKGQSTEFRCRVGHAYSPATMLAAESDMVEKALWGAVRTLKESASLCRRIAARTGVLREDFTRRAAEREQHAEVIRGFLESGAYRT